MPKIKNFSKTLLSVLTAGTLTVACGSTESPSTPGQYVVDSITIPSNPLSAAIDLDGDGGADNVIGNILNTLASVGNIDVQDAISNDISRGSTILLARVEADSFSNDDSITTEILLGDNPDPAPCADENDEVCGNHLNGGASFTLQTGGNQAAPLAGGVENSQMLVGPGETTIQISFSANSAPLSLNLQLATLSGFLTAGSIDDGIIGGAITEQDLESDVIPAVVVIINDAVNADCSLSVAEGCCESETSTGAQILQFFDTDIQDCTISSAEIVESPLVQSLLMPDIDLSGDGTLDAFSLGLAVTAVGANF